MNNYKLDKWSLIRYIKDKYKETYQEDINLLKLNKSLYFLYGYWVIDNIIKNEAESELVSQLFEPNFIAGKYGPIDDDIMNENKPALYSKANWNQEMENFVDVHLEKIFKVSNLQWAQLLEKCL